MQYVFNCEKNKGLRLVLKPMDRVIEGGKSVVKPGLSVWFRDGIFITPDKKLAEVLREIGSKYGIKEVKIKKQEK